MNNVLFARSVKARASRLVRAFALGRRQHIVLCGLMVSLGIMVGGSGSGEPEAKPHPAHVYLFWSQTSPFAVQAHEFLTRVALSNPNIRLDAFELDLNAANRLLFSRVLQRVRTDLALVPFTVIGNDVTIGYEGDDSTGAEFLARLEKCHRYGCPDRLYDLLGPQRPEIVMGDVLAQPKKAFSLQIQKAFAAAIKP